MVPSCSDGSDSSWESSSEQTESRELSLMRQSPLVGNKQMDFSWMDMRVEFQNLSPLPPPVFIFKFLSLFLLFIPLTRTFWYAHCRSIPIDKICYKIYALCQRFQKCRALCFFIIQFLSLFCHNAALRAKLKWGTENILVGFRMVF